MIETESSNMATSKSKHEPSRKNVNECINTVVNSLYGTDFKLTQEQRKCIESFVCGQDTIAILPTGYGKSLIYQMTPNVISELSKKGLRNFPDQPILIVICPLNYLMKEQVERCKAFNPAFSLNADITDTDFEKVKKGEFNFLFSSPEVLLEDKWRQLFLSDVYQKNVIGVVVDECHTVVKW